MGDPGADITIGFGCLWNRPRAFTWSHIPQSLLDALGATGPVHDLGRDVRPVSGLARVRHVRIVDRRLASAWRYRAGPLDRAARAVADAAARLGSDVIVTVPDLGVFDRPFFIYQDLSYDLLLREVHAGNAAARENFAVLRHGELEQLARRQREIFARAAGVATMSAWYARSLVEDSGLDPDKVHVVRPGASATTVEPPDRPEERTGDLLFVGRDFVRKGGDLLVASVRELRARGADLTLTVVGPRRRPVELGEESWIDFRGPQPTDAVAALMRSHAVFVMPTRFEAYGIVFHEALRAGTPVVGPSAYAVPEIVTDGVDGALFAEWSPDSVADAIERALSPEVRQSAFDAAPAQADALSWERAARELRALAASVA